MRRLITILALCIAPAATGQVTGLRGWNIFLDPGHSGTENDGVFGYSEAEKNLRVALALRDLLLEQTDIDTVYLSRTNDLQVVSLSQRSDMANSLGADWFHSIHSDASSSPTANSTLLLWGQLLSGIEKTPTGGRRMSDFMVDNLTRGMRTTTRGSRGDCGFYRSFITGACSSGGPYLSVNRRTTMPSELSEAGFHTSPEQNQRNMNAEWKRLEAQTFFWSILDFWGIPRPPVHIVAGYVTDLETGMLVNGATVSAAGKTYTTDTYQSLFRFFSSDPEQLRNGFYYLEDVGPGPLTVTVSADGHEPADFLITPVDNFFTFFDVQIVSNIPPRVSSSVPAQGEAAFGILKPIVIEFSRPMDRASVEAAVSFDPPVTGRFLWSNSDFTLTFRADSLPARTPITMSIAGTATGARGDPLDGNGDGVDGDPFILTFTTGSADTRAPRIADTYPANGQAGVGLDPIISVVMDEPLEASSIAANQVEVVTASGAQVAGQLVHSIVVDRSVLSFFPAQVLEPLSSYIVRVRPGLRDTVGNVRATQQQSSFSTRASGLQRETIDDFESDVETRWWPPEQSGSTTGVVPGSTSRSVETGIVNLASGSTASLRIEFEWEASAPVTLLREFLAEGSPTPVIFDSTYAIEAHVFGDGGGTLFRFAVDDRVPIVATENHEASPWYPIEWYGWRPVSWRPGRDGTGIWLGDGTLDGGLAFDSIQLARSEDSQASGTIIVDDLSLIRPGVVTNGDTADVVPETFRLVQNYPNPFRTSTTLRVELPEPGRLWVSIFNVLGEEVASLADGVQASAGPVELTWSPTDLPSGLYLARAHFGGRVRTLQMVRVK